MIRRFLFRFRAFFILSSSLTLLLLGIGVMVFPFQEVEQLRTGYFTVHLKGKDLSPDYEFVKWKDKLYFRCGFI